mgnify:CR=1 FL=1
MTSEPISSVEPNRRRSLRSWQPGDQPWELKSSTRGQQVLRDLASNDYLGLARHPAVIEAAAIAGVVHARELPGRDIESSLATFLRDQAPLLVLDAFSALPGSLWLLGENQRRWSTDVAVLGSVDRMILLGGRREADS